MHVKYRVVFSSVDANDQEWMSILF